MIRRIVIVVDYITLVFRKRIRKLLQSCHAVGRDRTVPNLPCYSPLNSLEQGVLCVEEQTNNCFSRINSETKKVVKTGNLCCIGWPTKIVVLPIGIHTDGFVGVVCIQLYSSVNKQSSVVRQIFGVDANGDASAAAARVQGCRFELPET